MECGKSLVIFLLLVVVLVFLLVVLLLVVGRNSGQAKYEREAQGHGHDFFHFLCSLLQCQFQVAYPLRFHIVLVGPTLKNSLNLEKT